MIREGKRILGFVIEVSYEVYVVCTMRKQVPDNLFVWMGICAEKL